MNRRQFGVLAGSALVAGPAFAAGAVDLDRLKLELRMGDLLELFGFYDGDEGVALHFQVHDATVDGRPVTATLGPNLENRVSRAGPRPFVRDLAPRTWRAIAEVKLRERHDAPDALANGLAGLVIEVSVRRGREFVRIAARLADAAKQG